MAEYPGRGGGGKKKPSTTTVDPARDLIRMAARLQNAKGVEQAGLLDVLSKTFRNFKPEQIRMVGQEARLPRDRIEALVKLTHARTRLDRGLGVMDALSRPQQAALGAMTEGFGGAKRGFLGEERYTPVQSILRATGKSEAEAAQAEAKLPGYVTLPANFAGSILTDPLTYLTFGVSASGRAAARSATAKVAASRGLTNADDIARLGAQIQSVGKKALTAAEQAQLGRGVLRGLKAAKGGIRIAGHRIPGTAVEGRPIAGHYAAAVDSTRAANLADQFRTLNKLRRGEATGLFRPGTTDDVARALGRAEAKAGSETHALLEPIYRAQRNLDDASRLKVTQALENPELVVGLSKTERKAFDLFDKIRGTKTGEQVKQGLLRSDEALAQGQLDLGFGDAGAFAVPTKKYFPRFRSEEAIKAGVIPGNQPSLTKALAKNLKARTNELRHLPTEQILDEAGRPLYNLDPGVATFKRAALANRDLAKMEFLREMRGIRAIDGTPLIQAGDDIPKALHPILAGTTKIDDEIGGMIVKELPVQYLDDVSGEIALRFEKALVHPALAKDEAFNRAMKLMSGEADREFMQMWEQGMRLWKSYATTFGPFSGGFAIRNFQGNLLNGYWYTNTSPIWYGRAIRLRNNVMKGLREGDAMRYVTPRYQRLIQEALDNGVIGAGFYSQELGAGQQVLKRLGQAAPSRATRIGRQVNPFSTENVLLRGGRKFNTAVEDTGRLGLYLAKRRGGFSVDDATGLVQKYLFDYGDVSKADAAIKKVVPFWTWTRKNVPLQLETILKNPGKITAQFHGLEAVRNELEPGIEDKTTVPNWMLGQEGVIGRNQAWIPDLPITSINDQIAPVVRLLKNLRGGPEADWNEFAREVTIAAGVGGPAAILPVLYQIASGKEVFSGREFRPGEKIMGLPSEVVFGIEALMPGVSKVRRIVDPGSRTQLQRILAAFFGANLYPINEQTKRNEMFRRREVLNRLREYYTRHNIEVPEGVYTGTRRSSGGGAKWPGG